MEVCGLLDHGGKHRGAVYFESVSSAQPITASIQGDFICDFCRDLNWLEQWAGDFGWPWLPPERFNVVVSDRFNISKSLVPAWSGRVGEMEFPTWRVASRKAAIAHELVHVLFPNGNRLLAEGLAVYLQARIGGNHAFPNFGRPLSDVARDRLGDTVSVLGEGDNQRGW